MNGWHFLRTPSTLRDGSTFKVGQWLPEITGPVMCTRGYHGSVWALDALSHAPGSIVCWCEYGGEIEVDSCKLVASRRRVVWQYDASRVLQEFACLCAEDAMRLACDRESMIGDPDPRSVAAVSAKRAWLRGEIDDNQLQAAWADARAAADAAGGRGKSTAISVAYATRATADAVRIAADAWFSATNSAWAAADAEWRDAEAAAALNATERSQNTRLEAMLKAGRR